MKKLLTYSILALSSLLAACQPENDVIENSVYLTDAQNASAKTIAIDENGASTLVSSRLGRSVATDVTIEYGVNVDALHTYNSKNGTDYQLLPESYYSFSEMKGVIKAGQISSSPITLNIKPFGSDIDVSKKYAVPVSILHADGVEIMESSSNLMILLDRVIVTSVPYLTADCSAIEYELESPVEYPKWTIEWNLCMDRFDRNNITQWRLYQGRPNTKGMALYTRFGDVTCKHNQFQSKVGSSKPESVTEFTPKKWYHIAVTYDGANYKLYVDGELDSQTPIPGYVAMTNKIGFGNDAGMYGKVSELRFWSVARSQAEIVNNMYIVPADSEGLEVYWKCNEGEGNIIQDYSGKGRHAIMKNAPEWEHGVRFPDDGK